MSAFTAIACQVLPDAGTCHRTFGIPVKANMDGTDNLLRGCDNGKRLIFADLIIIDAISMLAKWQMQLIDRCLRVRK